MTEYVMDLDEPLACPERSGPPFDLLTWAQRCVPLATGLIDGRITIGVYHPRQNPTTMLIDDCTVVIGPSDRVADDAIEMWGKRGQS